MTAAKFMKTMTWVKYAVGIGMVAILIAWVANNAIFQTKDDTKLGAAEIAKKSLAAYAALTSYSDEGRTVSSVGTTNGELTFSTKLSGPNLHRVGGNQIGGAFETGSVWSASEGDFMKVKSYSDEGRTVSSVNTTTNGELTFSTRLSRPNLYRVSWNHIGGSFGTGSVWSAGEGDFMKVKDGAPTKHSTMEQAWAGAKASSFGAGAATVPEIFFNLPGMTNLKTKGSNRLRAMARAGTRKPDEKVEDIDCYVLAYETNAVTQTLRIGKKDFLIRQIESSVKAAALNAMLEEQAKKANTGLSPNSRLPGDFKRVETHSKVSVNPVFTKADFAP